MRRFPRLSLVLGLSTGLVVTSLGGSPASASASRAAGQLAAGLAELMASQTSRTTAAESSALSFVQPLVLDLPAPRGSGDGVDMVDHGDLDGDGVEDLVVFRHDSTAGYAAVVTYLGNGDGTFTSSFEAETPGPEFDGGAIIDELTGDANPDLAAVSDGVAEVRIFPGAGDGTFGTPVALPVGSGITAARPGPDVVRSADLTGDGRSDLVLGWVEGKVTVLLADEAGGFAAPVDLLIDVGRVNDLGIADLDDDELPELLLAGQTAAQVLGNDGNGSFSSSSRLASGSAQVAVVAGDFNRDGHVDAVFTRLSGAFQPLGLGLFLGSGDGTLTEPLAWEITPGIGTRNSNDHLASDLDGDGHLDAQFATSNGTAVTAFGTGDVGQFDVDVWLAESPAAAGSYGQHLTSLAAIDVDDDDRLDLVVGVGGQGSQGGVTVLLADGTTARAYLAPRVYPTEDEFDYDDQSVALGDFTGDGHADLVTHTHDALVLLPGTSDATFGAPQVLRDDDFCFQGYPVYLRHVDADAHLDIVCTENVPRVAFGNGTGGVSLGRDLTVGLQGEDFRYVSDLLMSNVDAEAGDELIAITERNGNVAAASTDASSFTTQAELEAGVGIEVFRYDASASAFLPTADVALGERDDAGRFDLGLAAGDFDQSGSVDLVGWLDSEGFVGSAERFLLRGDGEGGFAAAERSDTERPSAPSRAGHAADLDTDGRPDVVSLLPIEGPHTGESLVVETGRGNGSFDEAVTSPSTADTSRGGHLGLEVVDLDGDGHLDAVVHASGTVEIHRGRGDATFAPPVHVPGGGGSSIGVGDLNGDGRPEVVVDSRGGMVVLVQDGAGAPPPPPPGAADLTVATVELPDAVQAGARTTVPYTVRNDGGPIENGQWVDRLYLSDDDSWDVEDRLLGSASVALALPAGSTYRREVVAPFVPRLPGQTRVIVRTDVAEQVSEESESNNLLVTDDTVEVVVPSLTSGVNHDLDVAPGAVVYRRLAAGDVDQLLEASSDGAGQLDLVVADGRLPTATDFDAAPVDPEGHPVRLLLPADGSERFVRLSRPGTASGSSSVALSTHVLGFEILEVSPSSGSSAGAATVSIRGGGFEPNAGVVLTGRGGERSATAVDHVDSSLLHATVDLSGLPTGRYDVRVENADGGVTAVDAFEVTEGPAGRLEAYLSLPGIARTGWLLTATVTYRNAGETDVAVPLLSLDSPQAKLRLPGSEAFLHGPVQVVGTTPGGPPGVLPPGAEASIQVEYVLGQEDTTITMSAYSPGDRSHVDWAAALAPYRGALSAEAWDHVLRAFRADVGTTIGEFAESAASAAVEAAGFGVDPNARGGIVRHLLDRTLATAPGAAVSGTLHLDDALTPLASTSVSTSASGATLRSAVSWYDGSFNLWDVPAGTHRLLVADHLLDEPVEVAVPTSASGVQLVVTAGEQLAGVVRGPAGPVPGATVTVQDGLAEQTRSVTTGPDGAYTVTGLSPSVVLVGARADGLVDAAPVEVTLTEGAGAAADIDLLSGGAIEGRVLLPGGGPASGATVRAAPQVADGDVADAVTDGGATTADADGNYRISGVEAGTYGLVATAPGGARAVVRDVVVTAGADTDGVDLALGAPQTVTGIVIDDEAGTPVAGAHVWSDAGGTAARPVTTRSDGTFSLPDQPAGPITIWASRDGYLDGRTPIEVGPDGATDAVVQLSRGGTITVEVERGDGSPLAGAPVTVFGTLQQRSADTGADGTVLFDHLPDGDYVVGVVNAGGQPSMLGRRDVRLAVGVRDAVVGLALPGGELSGRLLRADGTPASGSVSVESGGRVIDRVVTGPDGRYAFMVYGAQTLEVVGVSEELGVLRDSVEVVDGERRELDLRADDQGRELTVEVRSGGAAVEGATVSLVTSDSTVAPKGSGLYRETDGAGNAVFAGLPPGDYVLYVRQSGLAAQRRVVTLAGGDLTERVDVVPGSQIHGVVTGADGTRLVGAVVSVVDPESGEAFLAGSGPGGSYAIDLLPESTYEVWFTHHAFGAVREAGVVTTVSAPQEVDVTLPLDGATVTGRVVDASGNPVLGATVEAVDPGGHLLDSAGSGPDGRFRLLRLPTERLVVMVRATSVGAVGVEVTPLAGGPADVGDVQVGEPVASAVPPPVVGPATTTFSTFGVRKASMSEPAGDIAPFGLPGLGDSGALPPPQPHGADTVEFRGEWTKYSEHLEGDCPGINAALQKAIDASHLIDDRLRDWDYAYDAAKQLSDAEIALATTETIKLANETAGSLLNAASGLTKVGSILKKLGGEGRLTSKQIAAAEIVFDVVVGTVLPKAIEAYDSGSFASGDVLLGIAKKTLETLVSGEIQSFTAALGELPAGLDDVDLQDMSRALGAVGDAGAFFVGQISPVFEFYEQNQKVRKAFEAAYKTHLVYSQAEDHYYSALNRYDAALAELRDLAGGCGGGGGGPEDDEKDPPKPPPCEDCPKDDATTEAVGSVDPNDIVGPGGFGPQRWVAREANLGYLVRFENDPDEATAPAVDVVVTHPLDPDLDLSTFQLGDLGWGSVEVDVPPALRSFSALVGQDTGLACRPAEEAYCVRVEAGLDLGSRTITWSWRTVENSTGAAPSDPLAGFLPPNVTAPQGEGHASYSVAPRDDASVGSTVEAQASIVFDANDAIVTDPWVNTLDVERPSSTVQALPAESTSPFTVSWVGTDDGAGAASYDVYVSTDDGPFVRWKAGTAETSATYDGELDARYRFFARAVDGVGHRELGTPTAQAETTVVEVQEPSPSPTTAPTQPPATSPPPSPSPSPSGTPPACRPAPTLTCVTPPGGGVATGTSPATPEDVFQVLVSSPSGGSISVAEGDAEQAPPAGLTLLPVSADIQAPPGDADAPLRLVFRIDGSLLPEGVPPGGVHVLRDGHAVGECAGSDRADPDPCVTSRVLDGDDVVLTVLTSRASRWTFATADVACPGSVVPDAGFVDVADDSAHADAIDCLAWWGITRGMSDGGYAPAVSVSRGQMASFLSRLIRTAGGTLPAGKSSFVDTEGSVHRAAVDALASAGLVKGYGDGRFGPEAPVTRGQMATFLVNAYEHVAGNPLPREGDVFPDDDGTTHEDSIDRAAAAGFTLGRPGGGYEPASPVSRDQMASFLTRVLGTLVESGHAEAAPFAVPPAQSLLAGAVVTGRVRL